MLLPEIPADLAELLVMWFRASQREEIRRGGYPTECPSTRGYQPRGWRDDVVESGYLARLVDGVQIAIDRLPREHQCAAGILAKNAATGALVWRSPRLPQEPGELRRVMQETIDALSLALGLTGEKAAA